MKHGSQPTLTRTAPDRSFPPPTTVDTAPFAEPARRTYSPLMLVRVPSTTRHAAADGSSACAQSKALYVLP